MRIVKLISVIFYHTFRKYFANGRGAHTLFHRIFTTPREFMKLSFSSFDRWINRGMGSCCLQSLSWLQAEMDCSSVSGFPVLCVCFPKSQGVTLSLVQLQRFSSIIKHQNLSAKHVSQQMWWVWEALSAQFSPQPSRELFVSWCWLWLSDRWVLTICDSLGTKAFPGQLWKCCPWLIKLETCCPLPWTLGLCQVFCQMNKKDNYYSKRHQELPGRRRLPPILVFLFRHWLFL